MIEIWSFRSCSLFRTFPRQQMAFDFASTNQVQLSMMLVIYSIGNLLVGLHLISGFLAIAQTRQKGHGWQGGTSTPLVTRFQQLETVDASLTWEALTFSFFQMENKSCLRKMWQSFFSDLWHWKVYFSQFFCKCAWPHCDLGLILPDNFLERTVSKRNIWNDVFCVG